MTVFGLFFAMTNAKKLCIKNEITLGSCIRFFRFSKENLQGDKWVLRIHLINLKY